MNDMLTSMGEEREMRDRLGDFFFTFSRPLASPILVVLVTLVMYCCRLMHPRKPIYHQRST